MLVVLLELLLLLLLLLGGAVGDGACVVQLELDNQGQMVAGNVWMRKSDDTVRLDPFAVQGAQEAKSSQQVSRVKYVIDHSFKVVSAKGGKS